MTAGPARGARTANLFVIPLDQRRQWFRYHHLLRSGCACRLLPTRRGHLAAAEWLLDNQLTGGAVRHLVAGGAADRAADVIESSSGCSSVRDARDVARVDPAPPP